MMRSIILSNTLCTRETLAFDVSLCACRDVYLLGAALNQKQISLSREVVTAVVFRI